VASHYQYGRWKELQVAEFFARRGYEVARTQGSRGSFDLVATKGRRRLFVQVKATRKDFADSSRLPQYDQTRLLRSAAAGKAHPLLALVSRNDVVLFSARDLRVLDYGRLKPLRDPYSEHT